MFSLVELVLMFTTISILSATAVPKLMDFKNNTEQVINSSIASSFKTSINLVRLSYKTTKYKPFVVFNESGYPTRYTNHTNLNDCASLWVLLLNTNQTTGKNKSINMYNAFKLNEKTCKYQSNLNKDIYFTYNINTGTVKTNQYNKKLKNTL